VDYIIVVRHHVMSQQLFSSNCRQLGIATDPSVALPLNADAVVYHSNRQTFPRAF
jgi:hypothetical protein